MPPRRAIEEDFPIVEINRLAVPERNSFKPIYQMHKWFLGSNSAIGSEAGHQTYLFGENLS